MDNYLEYPFDNNLILRKKKAIKQDLLKREGLVEKKLAVLGGSTTSEIKDILELFLLRKGIKPLFYESDFNKYYEDIMFENPQLKEFCPDIIYIHTTNLNITGYPELNASEKVVKKLLLTEFKKFQSLWQKIHDTYKCYIIQNNFELPDYRCLGNLDSSDIHGKTYFINYLNMEFAKYAYKNKNFFINDINYLSSSIGLGHWYDKTLWYSYKCAVSYEAIPLLTHNIAKIIQAIYGKSKKCLVLDLDDTLWGGTIGDDGVNNIKIGNETSVSVAYTGFQKYIKELKNRGIILSVCSKNDLKNAQEGFLHPDSILKLDDFASFQANWEPKYKNVLQAAREINIDSNSMVFIDDNPVEREIVKSQIPFIAVPEIGSDITRFIEFIDKEGYFEPAFISEETLQRNNYYKENNNRTDFKIKFENYDDFLESLRMNAEISSFIPVYYNRITELINKTNQFNLTTKRYNYFDVKIMAIDNNYITLYLKLSDKFGDNGLISIIIGEIKNFTECHINLWLMSCRVLKRNVEFVMFDRLVEECQKREIKTIYGYYFSTNKNNMVADFYQNLGFKYLSNKEKDSVWVYTIPDKYIAGKRFIKIVNKED
jgi:FkbH-like protein